MVRIWVIFLLLSGFSIVAFNNCSGGFEVLESVGRDVSSLCRQKLVSLAQSQISFDSELCEDPLHYQCDLRRFRKGVGTEALQIRQCTNIAGMGEACIPVTVYNFDTTLQQLTADPSEIFEGGSYNRDEVSCLNTQIKDRNIALIQAEGTNVAEVLESVILSCRQRSRQ